MMTNAREFKITAAHVSDDLTRKVSTILMKWYGGYSRTEGFGGYTFKAGGVIEEATQTWVIATSENSIVTASTVASLARLYCDLGCQESIYFVDVDSRVFIVDDDGVMEDIWA